MAGARRFCEIRAAVPGLKDPQLARRLRELEQQGIVERRVVPSRPVLVEYALTPKGEDLRSVVAEVHRWAQRWLEAASATAPATTPGTGPPGARVARRSSEPRGRVRRERRGAAR
ncbi:MAG: winged helix-turn-helix transcriptional regulator [Limnochordaceae bacterium]|nr:winged helix-turn-helix transcriptional regulator [Limnochordaceae bacterium]